MRHQTVLVSGRLPSSRDDDVTVVTLSRITPRHLHTITHAAPGPAPCYPHHICMPPDTTGLDNCVSLMIKQGMTATYYKVVELIFHYDLKTIGALMLKF